MFDLPRILLAGLLCLVLVAASARAQGEGGSLDDQLLDDLNTDLLDGLDDAPASDESEAEPDSAERSSSPLDDDLLEGLGDAGGGEPRIADDHPLARIGRRMREAKGHIAEGNTSSSVQLLQQETIDDLAALIEEMERQRAGSQSGGKPKSGGQAQAGEQGGGEAVTEEPAGESTDRLGEAAAADSNNAGIDHLMREAWGHLPPRVRQQMQNASVEQFLPKYQTLIEDYYRRLAEQGAENP